MKRAPHGILGGKCRAFETAMQWFLYRSARKARITNLSSGLLRFEENVTRVVPSVRFNKHQSEHAAREWFC
jgi:hypothetical protein